MKLPGSCRDATCRVSSPVESAPYIQICSTGDLATEITWELEIEGKRYPCSCALEGGRFHAIGPKLPLLRLATGSDEVRFFRGNELFTLNPIVRERK